MRDKEEKLKKQKEEREEAEKLKRQAFEELKKSTTDRGLQPQLGTFLVLARAVSGYQRVCLGGYYIN